MLADPSQFVWFQIVITKPASTAIWGTCDTHGAVAVVLVYEEAGMERAPGKRSKAVRRISMALFVREKLDMYRYLNSVLI